MLFPFKLPLFIDGITSFNEIIGEYSEKYSAGDIIKNPKLLIDVKRKSILNGANALLAPTAGITHRNLEDLSLDDDFSEINKAVTSAVLNVADKDIPVGGCVVPSKLLAAPYGRDSFEEVYLIYLEKITIFKDLKADFVLIQNQNNLCDMRAAVLAAKSVGLPSFVIANVDEDGHTNAGSDFIAALITLQAMGASAFGINCTDGTDSLIKLISKAYTHSNIPLIAFIDSSICTKNQLISLSESGASIFIDKACYSSSYATKILDENKIDFSDTEEKDNYAAAVDCEAFFLPEILELSDPIYCDYNISEKIIDLDNKGINTAYIFLNSTDDSALLAENASMSRLPFLVHADNETVLEAALRYYQGRLIVDTHCDIDEKILKSLSKKYGAIMY